MNSNRILLAVEKDQRPGILYSIDFPNGKQYVGISSRSLKQRVWEHQYVARSGAKHSISRALRLYDDQFIAEVLLVAPMWYLFELEPAVIAAFGTRGRGGYNQAPGGPNPPRVSSLKRSTTNGHGMLGKHHTPEAIKKIGDASRARKVRPLVAGELNGSKRPEVRAKLSTANKKRTWTEEMRANLRKAWIKRKQNGNKNTFSS